jgi:hypothetical protein
MAGLYTDQQALNTSPENAQLQRQRKLAEALTGQAFNQPQGQMISGHYVAPSWTQQLAPVLTGAVGAYAANQIDKKEEKMAEALRNQETSAIEEFQKIKAEKGPAAANAFLAKQQSTILRSAGLKELLAPPQTKEVAEGGTIFQQDANGQWKSVAAGQEKYHAPISIDTGNGTLLLDPKTKEKIGFFNKVKEPGSNNAAESGLRTSFLNQAQPHIAISQAYRKIDSAPTTAAGDMSRIFGYMKILDPGSTVREGEYASAENARGVPDTVRAQYNRVMSGQRLTDKQRNEFTQAAGDLVNSQKQQFNEVAKYYGDIASRNQVNPANIIYDPYKDITLKTTPPKEPKAAVNANQQLNIPSASKGVKFLGFE